MPDNYTHGKTKPQKIIEYECFFSFLKSVLDIKKFVIGESCMCVSDIRRDNKIVKL